MESFWTIEDIARMYMPEKNRIIAFIIYQAGTACIKGATAVQAPGNRSISTMTGAGHLL
jgi:hypothetical protein